MVQIKSFNLTKKFVTKERVRHRSESGKERRRQIESEREKERERDIDKDKEIEGTEDKEAGSQNIKQES